MTISDLELTAYLDGELPAHRRDEVEAALAEDPALAQRLRRHREVSHALFESYGPIVDLPTPAVLLAASRASEPGPPARPAILSGAGWRSLAALAACLVVGVFVGQALTPVDRGIVGRGMVARGEVATALSRQLSSEPGRLYRVGLTVRRRDGTLCRTFSAKAADGAAGMACREGGGWRIVIAAPAGAGTGGGDYRTAAGDLPPPVAAAAQDAADGPALDLASEEAARARGWR